MYGSTAVYYVCRPDGTPKEKKNTPTVREQMASQLKALRAKVMRANEKTAAYISKKRK